MTLLRIHKTVWMTGAHSLVTQGQSDWRQAGVSNKRSGQGDLVRGVVRRTSQEEWSGGFSKRSGQAALARGVVRGI